jgi:hypothetical protein
MHCSSQTSFNFPPIVALSMTSRINREHASLLLAQEFDNLLVYCENQYGSSALENRIYDIWMQSKLLIATTSRSDGCFPLKHIKPVFDLLKIFYHIVPTSKQVEILKLKNPIFIAEMTSKDSDEEAWKCFGLCSDRIHSLVVELKKIGLFHEGSYNNNRYRGLSNFQKSAASFFLDNSKHTWNNLCLVEYPYNFGLFKKNIIVRFDREKSLKWETIKQLSNYFFQDESRILPLSDLKRKCYDKLRSQIIQLKEFYPLVSRELTLKLIPGKFCFRFSTNEVDNYGNFKIVLSAKTPKKKVYHSRFDIENLQNLEEFRKTVNNKLEEMCNVGNQYDASST